MNPLSRSDLIKHWLLDTAVSFPRSLIHILPVVRGLTLNAIEIPGCDAEDYALALGELFGAGMLRFRSEDSEDDTESPDGVTAILSRFLCYTFEPPEVIQARGERISDEARQQRNVPTVRYSLTDKGGVLWESIAEPRWEQFYNQSSDYATGDAMSPDLTLLMAKMGWFQELSGEEIDIQSIKIEEKLDHQVLYWKKLPHIYEATFNCRQGGGRWKRRGDYPMEPEWFRSWWLTTASFYTEPWKLPSWPKS